MILEGIALAVGLVLVIAAITDIRHRKIPNWIPLTVFGLYAVYLGVQWAVAPAEPLIQPLSSLATGAIVTVVFTGFFAFGWLGGGDVKLISALGFWAGKDYIVSFILIMAIMGGLVALFYFLKHSHRPDIGINSGKISQKIQGKDLGEEEIASKHKIKKTYIPYGVAISVSGLFVVNQLLTFWTS